MFHIARSQRAADSHADGRDAAACRAGRAPRQLAPPNAARPHAAHAARRLARACWLTVLPPVLGIALLVGIWALLTMNGATFPTPGQTCDAAVKLFGDPFYRKGPNDQGIGWNILISLQRVGIGFGLAALVGIPLGFMIGRFEFLNRMVVADHQPAAPGVAAGLAADRPAGVQGAPTRRRSG